MRRKMDIFIFHFLQTASAARPQGQQAQFRPESRENPRLVLNLNHLYFEIPNMEFTLDVSSHALEFTLGCAHLFWSLPSMLAYLLLCRGPGVGGASNLGFQESIY